ncbi:MAG: hypothetical protein WCW31_05965 [Patescibacteria group bacterium]|jgi:hypothetical protein
MKAEFTGYKGYHQTDGSVHFALFYKVTDGDVVRTFYINSIRGTNNVPEGLHVTEWPDGARTVALSIVYGGTRVTKKWVQADALQGEFVLDFALSLNDKLKDNAPLFTVELEFEYVWSIRL